MTISPLRFTTILQAANHVISVGYEKTSTKTRGTPCPGHRAGEGRSRAFNPGVANSKSQFLSTAKNAFMDDLETSTFCKKNSGEFEKVF